MDIFESAQARVILMQAAFLRQKARDQLGETQQQALFTLTFTYVHRTAENSLSPAEVWLAPPQARTPPDAHITKQNGDKLERSFSFATMWSALPASWAARYGRLVVSQLQHQKKHGASVSLFGGSGTARAYSSVQQKVSRLESAMVRPIVGQASRCKSTAASANAAGTKKGFVAWYEAHLESSPVRTKMITGSLLWGLGDLVAQLVPHFVFGDDEDDSDKSDNANGNATAKPFVYDYARTGRAVFFGFAVHAPLSHVHYNFLEWMTVRGGFQGLSVPVFKTIMEQFVYWSWFSNSLYHGAMGSMQGWTAQQCYDRIADVLWDTQKAQWVFWIPVQLLNFNFVPVRHQLNVVLLTSVVW